MIPFLVKVSLWISDNMKAILQSPELTLQIAEIGIILRLVAVCNIKHVNIAMNYNSLKVSKILKILYSNFL